MSVKSLQPCWDAAETFPAFLETVVDYRELWHSIYERAKVPEDLLSAWERLESNVNLLAIAEDWCGDAVDPLPPVVRLAEMSANLDFRVISRDAHAALIDDHLSGNSRAIPVVIVLDADFRELGWWGSRPSPLQDWVRTEARDMPSGERFKHVRRWHSKDRGRTIMTELLQIAVRGQGLAFQRVGLDAEASLGSAVHLRSHLDGDD